MPVGGAHGPVLGRGRPVAVLDPGRGLFRGRASAFDVHRDRGLGAHAAAERDELVRADVAGLGLVLPGEVDPDGALVAGPDAPRPVVVLGDVAAGPAEEGRPQRRHQRLDVGPHAAHGVAGQERQLVHPHVAPATFEEDREAGVGVGPLRTQLERVSLPVALNILDLGFGIHRSAGSVFLERHPDAPVVAGRLQPQVPLVGDPRPHRDPRLVEAVSLDDPVRQLDPKRVLDRLLLEEVVRDGIGDLRVPAEGQPVVVDAVVRVALPVAGEADVVGRFLEAAVPDELGGQPALHALVHELEELPVEPLVDPAFDLRGVDDDAGVVGLRAGTHEGGGEDQPSRPAAFPAVRHVHSLRTKTTVGSTG